MAEPTTQSRWQRFLDNDVTWSFLHTPSAIVADCVTVIAVSAALAAP